MLHVKCVHTSRVLAAACSVLPDSRARRWAHPRCAAGPDLGVHRGRLTRRPRSARRVSSVPLLHTRHRHARVCAYRPLGHIAPWEVCPRRGRRAPCQPSATGWTCRCHRAPAPRVGSGFHRASRRQRALGRVAPATTAPPAPQVLHHSQCVVLLLAHVVLGSSSRAPRATAQSRVRLLTRVAVLVVCSSSHALHLVMALSLLLYGTPVCLIQSVAWFTVPVKLLRSDFAASVYLC